MISARANVAGQRIFDILDASLPLKRSGRERALAGPGSRSIRGRPSVGYDAISPVLLPHQHRRKARQIIALMGPTVAADHPFVKLMPRSRRLSGAITIDATDIRASPSLLSALPSVSCSRTYSCSVYVREKIAYGAYRRDGRAIVAAQGRPHPRLIADCPTVVRSWVGERGITLSGGQKQRVAIARTLLLDPRILILDDSTSSVDTQTEYQIQQSMAKVMEGRTTFVIAQRLRTVKMADQIIVLQDGQVVEQGRHEELLETDGIYRQIYDLELRDQEEALAPAPIEAEAEAEAATAAGS